MLHALKRCILQHTNNLELRITQKSNGKTVIKVACICSIHEVQKKDKIQEEKGVFYTQV